MKPILNSQFELPTDGWCHAMAYGEFPNSLLEPDPDRAGTFRRRRVLQICDRESALAMVEAFNRTAAQTDFCGLLVDRDHESDNPERTTDAWGWVMGLENREDGLYARIRWTDLGEPAVRGGRFRFLSPVFNPADCLDLGNGRLRPLSLEKLGLTNDPNIRPLRPLSNRASSDLAEEATQPAADETTATDLPGTTGRKESNMDYKKELLALLGLGAEATDEQVSAACAARTQAAGELENARKDCVDLKNRAEKAEADLATHVAADLDRQVEADLETHKAVIANRDEMKAALLSNRAETLKVLAALHKPAETLLNRRDGATPQSRDEDRAALRNRKVAEYRAANRCDFNQAWNAVRATSPELFKNE